MTSLSSIITKNSTPLQPLPTGLKPLLPVEKTPIKAVIFDLYGTLFISGSGDIGIASENRKEDALQNILRKHEVSVPENYSVSAQLISLINEDHAESKLAGITFPEVEIRTIWKKLLSSLGHPNFSIKEIERIALEYETVVNPVWPMPELKETLSQIHQRGLQTGIVSNAQFYTPLMFEAFYEQTPHELGFAPELCFYSYETKQAKPGTHLFQLLKDALLLKGITPEETLYVGNDLLNDIYPAHQLGFITVLSACDQRSLRLRTELDLPQPDAVITELAQLRSMLSA